MKVITEAMLRDELRSKQPEVYYIPDNTILSPAGREYLQGRKIKIAKEEDKPLQEKVKVEATAVPGIPDSAVPTTAGVELPKPKYVDDATGAFYYEKPEHMTQLSGNILVNKDDKRIVFRGKLDALEAQFVLAETEFIEMKEDQWLLDDLEDILKSLRLMMRCDVFGEAYERDTMIGLTHDELRDHSHHPMKYYKVKQMVLPTCSLGKTYAKLNLLRTAVREVEVSAAEAFHVGNKFERGDIIEELNRMSSAMHIIMCKYLAKLQSGEVQ